jgi:hypothetical protein
MQPIEVRHRCGCTRRYHVAAPAIILERMKEDLAQQSCGQCAERLIARRQPAPPANGTAKGALR